MSVLISLLIFCIVVGLILWLISYLPLPAPWGMVVRVIAVVIALLYLLERMGMVSRF